MACSDANRMDMKQWGVLTTKKSWSNYRISSLAPVSLCSQLRSIFIVFVSLSVIKGCPKIVVATLNLRLMWKPLTAVLKLNSELTS